MERIAVTLDDGSVAILYFVTSGRSPSLPFGATWIAPGLWLRQPTEENVASEVMKTFHGDGIANPLSWRRMPETPPGDRSFRDAWIDSPNGVTHSMPKARGIHLARLRAARETEFTRLDAEWMRATGQGETAEADRIEGERQALRDLPTRVAPALEAAATVEELKRVR